jgi:hypothetical protein
MDAGGWIALAAAVGAYGHIGWAAYAARRHERSDVRVTVREEPAVVMSESYVLTVVVTNRGPATERIERIGLWFDDATGVFPPRWEMSGQGTQQEVDVDIGPRANYRWPYDFGSVRFRHGLGYRPWALLATGQTIEGRAGVVSEKGLRYAGLGHMMLPISTEGENLPPISG